VGISRSNLLEELRRVAKIVDRSPTEADMIEHACYAYSTYFRYFESWTKAKELAGVPASGPSQITQEALIDELKRVNKLVSGPPTRRDMDAIGDFPSSTYKYRFESWNDALETADLTVNQVSPGEGTHKYGPDWWRYRRKALKRDRGQCRVCGTKFPDFEYGLHVHHITPLREFEDDSDSIDYEKGHALDNLVTLCPPCHWEFENRFTDSGVEEFVRKAEKTIIRKELFEDRPSASLNGAPL
jgi:5-methylcytosine-specific restriction endonuclease McrA